MPSLVITRITPRRSSVIEAHNDHDVELMLAHIEEGVMIRNAASGEPALSGKDAASRLWSDIFATFPDHRFEIVDMTVDDNRVFAEVTESGTMKGPLGPNPPTGQRFSVAAAFRMDLSNGRIRAITSYFDMSTVMRQPSTNSQSLAYRDATTQSMLDRSNRVVLVLH